MVLVGDLNSSHIVFRTCLRFTCAGEIRKHIHSHDLVNAALAIKNPRAQGFSLEITSFMQKIRVWCGK